MAGGLGSGRSCGLDIRGTRARPVVGTIGLSGRDLIHVVERIGRRACCRARPASFFPTSLGVNDAAVLLGCTSVTPTSSVHARRPFTVPVTALRRAFTVLASHVASDRHLASANRM